MVRKLLIGINLYRFVHFGISILKKGEIMKQLTNVLAILVVAIFLCIASSANVVHATPFSVSDQQLITRSGQVFNFNFSPVPTSGTTGQFSITLNGDFSGFTTESAVATIDLAGGFLDLGVGGNGIITNTISGLTLNSYNSTTFAFDDRQLDWVFDMSDTLLNTIIADGSITTTVTNDPGVNPFSRVNPDFVRVGYRYESVPEPATLLFLGTGLIGMVGFRRKFKK